MSYRSEVRAAHSDLVRLIQQSTDGAVADLRIRVDADGVHITGHATTYYVKQLATQAALSACAGRCVTNEIHVRHAE